MSVQISQPCWDTCTVGVATMRQKDMLGVHSTETPQTLSEKVGRGSLMINAVCQPEWDTTRQSWQNLFWWSFARMSMEKTGIRLCKLSKEDGPGQCGWQSPEEWGILCLVKVETFVSSCPPMVVLLLCGLSDSGWTLDNHGIPRPAYRAMRASFHNKSTHTWLVLFLFRIFIQNAKNGSKRSRILGMGFQIASGFLELALLSN